MSGYGKRADATEKGPGWFGELRRPDGSVSTELSIGVNLGGKEVEIPMLVPTLSASELKHLLSGGEPNPQIVEKAVEFATTRIKAGASPFARNGEQVPLPNEQMPAPGSLPGDDFLRGFNKVRGAR